MTIVGAMTFCQGDPLSVCGYRLVYYTTVIHFSLALKGWKTIVLHSLITALTIPLYRHLRPFNPDRPLPLEHPCIEGLEVQTGDFCREVFSIHFFAMDVRADLVDDAIHGIVFTGVSDLPLFLTIVQAEISPV